MQKMPSYDSLIDEFRSLLKILKISHRKLAKDTELPNSTVANILHKKSKGATYTNITKIHEYIRDQYMHPDKKHPDKPLPISGYVERPPDFLLQTDKISKAKKMMDEKSFDCIPILIRKGHRIVGRVRHPDVYGGRYKNDQVQIKTIMRDAPPIIPDTTDATVVREMLKKMKWDCIVLQKKDRYVGIITYWNFV